MTNEQTAILLEGYASLLFVAMEEVKKTIPATEEDNLVYGKRKVWPQLYEIDQVHMKLRMDIDVLKQESPTICRPS